MKRGARVLEGVKKLGMKRKNKKLYSYFLVPLFFWKKKKKLLVACVWSATEIIIETLNSER